jgi:transposase
VWALEKWKSKIRIPTFPPPRIACGARKRTAVYTKQLTRPRHLLEKEPISKLCDEVGLQPTVFYRWQKEFFENGAAAFEQKRPTHHSAEQERIAYLEKKIQTKDEVLAELMAEHVALKKEVGEL